MNEVLYNLPKLQGDMDPFDRAAMIDYYIARYHYRQFLDYNEIKEITTDCNILWMGRYMRGESNTTVTNMLLDARSLTTGGKNGTTES